MTSGNRAYANGANFERRIKQRLEQDGWTVFRTAGSHTPCDLVGVRLGAYESRNVRWTHPIVAFVQAKGGQAAMTRKKQAEFRDYAQQHGARPLLVTRGMQFHWLDEPNGKENHAPAS